MASAYRARNVLPREEAAEILSRFSGGSFRVDTLLRDSELSYADMLEKVNGMPEEVDYARLTIAYHAEDDAASLQFQPFASSDRVIDVARRGFHGQTPVESFDDFRRFLDGYDWK